MIKALRQVLQSHWVDRFVVDEARRGSFAALLERADDRLDRPYRIDEFDPDTGPGASVGGDLGRAFRCN